MLPKIFLSEFLLLFALNAFSQCIHCLRERLLQQKSKEKAFYISKACAFGHKNILSPEGTQAIKIRWGKMVICSQGLLLLILSHTLLPFLFTCDLLNYINLFRLQKERGETLNKFGNPRTEEKVCGHPWERGKA